jgi:hypothetical protein
MLKLTMLLAVVMTTACALDEDTSSIESKSSCSSDCGCDNECPPPPPPEGPTCRIRGVDIDLDSLPANVDSDDERVAFCHATGSESNPYVLIRTSIEGCNGHANENHEPGGNTDIFPSQGCAD